MTFTIAKPLYDDLKAIYLHAFDAFVTDPSEIERVVPGIANTRHARELLGVLTNQAGLLTVDTNNDGVEVWQILNPGTYDDNTREEAEAVFDQTFEVEAEATPAPAPNPPSATTAPRPATPQRERAADGTLPDCLCGCGAKVGLKSNYKPGHDARHAGNTARAIADQVASGAERDLAMKLLDALPSTKLKYKAEDMADRLIQKAGKAVAKVEVAESPAAALSAAPTEEAEAAVEEAAEEEDSIPDEEPGEPVEEDTEPEPERGVIKHRGREYEAFRYADGKVLFVRDGKEQEATKAATATFKAV